MAGRVKIATCIHCRQMKVKCDAKEVFPAPCSRCKRQNLSCTVDPLFKRTAKRRQADAMEQELREIKATGRMPPVDDSPGQSSTSMPVTTTPSAFAPLPAAATYPEYGCRISASDFTTQTIGDIEIPPNVIADLFNCYFSTFQQEFPILPDAFTIIKGYYRCPLLFWTITAVASTAIEEYAHYNKALEPHVRQLTTDIFAAADHPLGTVQALLILCWWPFPFQATRNDPTWSFCGLAVHTALRFGIHRPQHFPDFVYNDCLDEAGIQAFQNAWIGCFIVNHIVSSDLGVPATVNPDNVIMNALKTPRPSKLPKLLYQLLQIAYQGYNSCQLLGNNDSVSSGLLPSPSDIMKVLDSNLRTLESELGSDLAPSVELALLRAKLLLYSFAFTDVPDGLPSMTRRTNAPQFLRQADLNAIKLIEAASTRASLSPWSLIERTSIIYATHVLLSLMAIPEYQEHDLTKNAIRQAWNLLNSRSQTPNDSISRVCNIIAYLSRCDPPRNIGSTVSTQSRMAANVLVSSVWRARARFSDEIRRSRPSDYTSAAALEDMFQLDLGSVIDADFLQDVGLDLSADFGTEVAFPSAEST